MRGMSLKLVPVLVIHLLGLQGLSVLIADTSWTPRRYSKQSYNKLVEWISNLFELSNLKIILRFKNLL